MKLPVSSKNHILRRVHQMASGRRGGRYWDEAWEHIKAHLSEGAGANKATHAVFSHGFRSRDAVADLIVEATHKPSDTEWSFLTGPGGQPTGAPCLIIRRWFNFAIGTCSGEEVHTLWIIADACGKLITAYPRIHPHYSK